MERNYFFYLTIMGLRYFLFAGSAFLIFYVIFKNKFSPLKIQKMFPKKKDYYREIGYSLLTMLIFTGYAFVIFRTSFVNHTLVYKNVSDYSLWYFFGSVILAIVIHDTYFYWTHRLMHHPKLFRYFHLVHHKSVNPSPWAAYSFHPLEAIVEGSIILIIVFIMPIHPYAIALFILFMFVFNIYGHLGYEIFPRWLLKSRFGKYFNTSVSHNMHHKFFHDNYGLYFRFWDVVMKTTNPKYRQTLAALKSLDE